MTLDELFEKELKTRIGKMYGGIDKVPLPKGLDGKDIVKEEKVAIKGIEDEFYSKLNKELVVPLSRGDKIRKRVIDKATRAFKVDKFGDTIYEDYSPPIGSIVIKTSISLNLPYKYNTKEDGFDYIDFIEVGEDLIYLYAIPKKYLYMVNQTALAVSVRTMQDFDGSSYRTWDMGKIYLHIIPFKPKRVYKETIILAVGTYTNYDDEIRRIISYWQEENFIPELALCQSEFGENLIIEQLENKVDYYYTPVDATSLAEKEYVDEVLKEEISDDEEMVDLL